MEQQIANILAQTTTKTRKIQQLLMLGLTRRQVARPSNETETTVSYKMFTLV